MNRPPARRNAFSSGGCQPDATTSVNETTSGASNRPLTVLLARLAKTDPDLARILDAWPKLPAHIRAAVLALVATAAPTTS
jgi:hypothetical protein